MPTLGEFMGALLSDAASARVRADLEALKIAEAYSGHELLKHLPVPRFRLPEVTIEFPVVVSEIWLGSEPSGDNLFTQPSEAEVTKTLDRAIADVRLTGAEQAELHSLVNNSLKQAFLEGGPRIVLSSDRVSDRAATVASAAFARMRVGASEEATKLGRLVKDAIRGLLLTKLADTPHVEVRIASGELKAHNNPESLLRVRLTISEDAYEIVEQAAPSTSYKLTPE